MGAGELARAHKQVVFKWLFPFKKRQWAQLGRRQALWDLETTMTTFNNNFILRAHLEQSDGKTCGWWQMGAGEYEVYHSCGLWNMPCASESSSGN